jgi:hypothetical protein
MHSGERLIPITELPRRGERVLGEWETDAGMMLHVIHWRRLKRIDNQEQKRLRGWISPGRCLPCFMGDSWQTCR